MYISALGNNYVSVKKYTLSKNHHIWCLIKTKLQILRWHDLKLDGKIFNLKQYKIHYCRAKCGLQIPEVKTLLDDLWGKNCFHNKVKISLLLSFSLTCIVEFSRCSKLGDVIITLSANRIYVCICLYSNISHFKFIIH